MFGVVYLFADYLYNSGKLDFAYIDGLISVTGASLSAGGLASLLALRAVGSLSTRWSRRSLRIFHSNQLWNEIICWLHLGSYT